MKAPEKFPIEYSCYVTRSREGEKFSQAHAISYVMSGRIVITDEFGQYEISAGETFFFSRNALVKYNKYPPSGGLFKSVTLFLDQTFLRSLALELNIDAFQNSPIHPLSRFQSSSVTATFMQSLIAYENILSKSRDPGLLDVKRKEAVLILIGENPDFTTILFNFSEPGKIDLEGFMQKNFHFKVDLSRFAYLTGRSLSTFKRDFGKIFHMTPNRWLLKRRLEEAHSLITIKHHKISEVYNEVGFEDLSHFSFAYKKHFGFPPSGSQNSRDVKNT